MDWSGQLLKVVMWCGTWFAYDILCTKGCREAFFVTGTYHYVHMQNNINVSWIYSNIL